MSDFIRRWTRQCKAALESLDMAPLAQRIEQIQRDALRTTFVVTVVGEFSRGKSTFINRLLGEELLPVGDLPTTAILTRLRYNPKRIAARIDTHGQCLWRKPITSDLWNGLTAEDPEGAYQEGVVVMGLNHQWLGKNAIEVIDTPGAGDLDDARMKVVGNMLMRSDAIIMTIDATHPMSMTEQTFMEQRVMVRKTPYMLLVLNRLDLIPLKERNTVIDWVRSKLRYWGMDMPVFVPYEVELPDEKYSSLCGIDKVRQEIKKWSNDPKRLRLLDEWVQMRTEELLNVADDMLKEEEHLLDASDAERQKAIDAKVRSLDELKMGWERLQLEMRQRLEKCYELFRTKTDERAQYIVEQLQYEVAHAPQPQKWWEEDYPYRLKKELANMGLLLENTVKNIALEDVRWMNGEMNKQFNTTLATERLPQSIDHNEIAGHSAERHIHLDNINKRMNIARLGTAALSIGGAILLSATGFGVLSIVATMGVGTGASIITSDFFSKKIDQQCNELKRMLANDIPMVVDKATSQSEEQISVLYHDIMNDARERQQTWYDAQKQAIEQSNRRDTTEERKLLAQRRATISNLRKLTMTYNIQP